MCKKILQYFVLFIFVKNSIYANDNSIITRTVWNNPSPGYLFLAPMDSRDISVYDNSGFKVYSRNFGFFSQGFVDFKLHPNGKLSAFDFISNRFVILDSNFNVVDTVSAVGYNTDFHEFLILPNGNYMLIAEADTIIDMSRLIPNGHPNCRVNNFKIQEINYRTKQVVWEWNALEHFSILDATEDITLESNYIRPFHINSIELLSDGNLLISCRHLDEITKINRSTGEIIWRMGGSKCRNNQFVFVNDTINNFFGFSHQHDPRELSNGNILLFDNGNLRPSPFSRAVEYRLDEANRRVTKVWEYRAPNNIVSNAMGSCQRLPNGNTLISWGGTTAEGGHNYLLSEVTPEGNLALEFYSNVGTYRGYRHIFKMDAVSHTISTTGLVSFNNAEYHTNVSILVSNLNGAAKITVEKHRYPPHNLNQGGPCSVIPYRWVVTKQSSNSVAGYLYFDLSNLLGSTYADSLKIYYRESEGFGAFNELNTYYNSQNNRLEAPFAGVGEYCIGTFSIRVPTQIHPENNAINVLIPTRFVWKKFVAGEKYHLQISTKEDFTNILYDINNISDTSYTINNLNYGKTYYWRVRAVRDNCQSEWSSTMKFTTVYEGITTYLPADSSLDLPLKVRFTWNPSSEAWAYQIQIAMDRTFSFIVLDTITNSPAIEIESFDYYSTYYWRVRLLRGEQYGIWSDIKMFRTTISPPKLLYPANYAKNLPVDGELKWNSVPGAIHYYLVVSKNPQFHNNEIEIVDLKETFFNYTNFENATVYYWRVRATSENGKSQWSETYNFTTQLVTPELVRPPFADTLAPTSGILRWKEVPLASNYEIQISEDENFAFGVIKLHTTAHTWVGYSFLAHSTKYFWRVRAYSDELESQWSKTSWFRTLPENYLPAPILIYPQNNATNVKIKEKLIWNAIEKSDSYQIQIAFDIYFNNIILDKITSDTSLSIGSLAYGTKYFWRVKANSSNFISFWSEVYQFTTALREPILLAPLNLATISNFPIEFEWEKTSRNAFYQFQIAYDSLFEFIFKSQLLYEQNNYTLSTAPSETWLYWRVKAISGILESDWSEVRKLRTLNFNSVQENTKPNFKIVQINDGLYFFHSEDKIDVISIYNNLGILINQSQILGNSYLLDLNTFPVGIYFIKIQINNNFYFVKVLNNF